MKHRIITLALLGTLVAVSPVTFGQGRGHRGGSRSTSAAIISSAPVGTSTAIDFVTLWEEEKLARDVYVQLAASTNLPVFSNIAQSENRHMMAVSQLVAASGINPSTLQDVPGVFANATYQQLYQSLVATGKAGLVDALLVGAKIEEMDIADLQRMISGSSDAGVRQVLNHLLQASGNHLRAFTSQLSMAGVDYSPQILSAATYQQIINANGSQGHGDNGAHGNNGGPGTRQQRGGRQAAGGSGNGKGRGGR